MVVGDEEMAVGKPVICTLIDEEKPFTPTADRETDVEPPATTEEPLGFTASVKSGAAGAVGACGLLVPPPAQPQQTANPNARRPRHQAAFRRNAILVTFDMALRNRLARHSWTCSIVRKCLAVNIQLSKIF